MGTLFAIGWRSEARLHCDRQTDECVLEQHGAFASERFRLSVGEIRGTAVEETVDSEGDRYYGAVLHTERGTYDLSRSRSIRRSTHERLAAVVEEYVSDGQQRELDLHDKPEGWTWLLVFAVPIVGLYLLIGARTVAEVEVMPQTGLLLIRKRRWWQRSGREESVPLSEIESVEVERTGSRTQCAVLLLKSGERKPLFGFSAGGSGAYRRAERLRELLARVRD